MRFTGYLVLPLLLLSACATTNQRPPARPTDADRQEPDISSDPQKNQQVRLDLIRGMLDKKQYYAALAYIEDQKRSGEGGNELLLLEADARRHLLQTAQAEVLYRKLIGTAYEGQAYHGLGLLYVDSDINTAVQNLQRASQRLPTDVEIRGDLGYALMEAGRYTEAMPELSTAAELAPGQLKSRNNLIILMLLTGNDLAASKLAQQSGATPETMARLREQAQRIRNVQNTRAAKAAG
jgi:Flp pilus assembly protein TadD